MHVIGELVDVGGKAVKDETSRGGGALVMICSKGNLSMVAGADVGLLELSVELWSIGGAGITG